MFAFLAQASQPMLAHQIVEVGRRRVLVWAVVAQGAVTLQKGFAYWAIRIKSETVSLQQEGGEREFVFWVLMFQDLSCKIFGA
jgi:hypothetical protein